MAPVAATVHRKRQSVLTGVALSDRPLKRLITLLALCASLNTPLLRYEMAPFRSTCHP